MSHREVNSPRLPKTDKEFGVSGGIVAGNTLFLSGHTPLDADFKVVGTTFEEQVRAVFEAITATLEEAGFTWDDMVKLVAFVHTSDRAAMWTYCSVLKEYLARYSSKTSVAHTYMLVGEMQVPEMMLEVEGIAVKQS